MIKVDVRVDDDLDGLKPKSEVTNVRRNLSSRLGQIAVDEDIASVRCNQDGTQAVCTHVVRVPKNAEWRLRTVPFSTRRAVCRGLSASSSGEQHKAAQAATAEEEEPHG